MKQGVCYVPALHRTQQYPHRYRLKSKPLHQHICRPPSRTTTPAREVVSIGIQRIRKLTPSPGLTIVPPCKGCNVQNKEMVAGIQDTLDIKWTPSGPHRCEMVSLTDIACLTILFFLFTLGTTHLQKLLPSQVSQQVVVLVWWTVTTRTTAHRVPTP